MKFKVYPQGIEVEIDEVDVTALEVSMSGETLIVHAPGLQFAVTNGRELLETDAFARGFIEMSPQRWIRASAVQSMQRFGDDYVRVMLTGTRQPFDLFPKDGSLKQAYNDLRQKLPRAPSFLSLDVAA